MVKKLHQMTSLEEEERVASLNPRVPIVMGDFTEWKPRPFTDIIDYMETTMPQFDQDAIVD